MQKREPIRERVSDSGTSRRATFSVIATYDSCEAQTKVNDAFAWLYQSFHDDLRMTFHAWAADKLVCALDTRALSVRLGIEADLIIICSRKGEPMSDHTSRWLDSIFVQERSTRATILALVGDAETQGGERCALREDLQSWASCRHAALVCCSSISDPASRHLIHRLVNACEWSPGAELPRMAVEPGGALPGTLHQAVENTQTMLTAAQVQEVRVMAYLLWLGAGRPAGRELDFWLQAERQVINTPPVG